MSKIRFVFYLFVIFCFSGNVAGAVDLTGTWDWYGVEMSITQTGQQVNAVINISQPDIGNYAGDQMFYGTLNAQTLTGKIKVHGTPEYRKLCPATYFSFTDFKMNVSADGKTLDGQLKDIIMNNDCTITQTEAWVSTGILTRKTSVPISGCLIGGGAGSSGIGQTQCVHVSDDLTIPVACADYKNVKYKFDLNYTSDLYWKMNLGTFGNSGTGNCLSLENDLKLSMDCVEYKGNSYGFNLNYSPKPDDPFSFYWKIDLNTFVQKTPPAGGVIGSRVNKISSRELTFETDIFVVDGYSKSIPSLDSHNFTIENFEAGGASLNFKQECLTYSQMPYIGEYSAILLMDQTGSMTSNDPSDLRIEAAKIFFNALGSNDNAMLAAFAKDGNLSSNFVSWGKFGKSDYSSILQTLANTEGGTTPLYDATSFFVKKTANESPNQNKAVIVFTDGQDNQSIATLAQVVSESKSNGVKVFCVALSDNTDRTLLSQMSIPTGGGMMYAADARSLISIFGTLGNLLKGDIKYYKICWKLVADTDIFGGSDSCLSASVKVNIPGVGYFYTPFYLEIH